MLYNYINNNMKGIKYNCIINEKTKLENLEMKELVENINDIFNRDYNGLLKVNPTKIYNLIKRPKLASKNLKRLLCVSYVV